jgi:hypothetical protein
MSLKKINILWYCIIIFIDDIGGSARYVFKFYTNQFTISTDGRIYIAFPTNIPYRLNRENFQTCFFFAPDEKYYV